MVAQATERILMSPSLGDFFELRLADMGPLPVHPGDEAAAVARLVLELTSRPGEAARNFSALVVIDRSAVAVDQVLRGCQGDPVLAALKVRFRGMASRDDRPPATPGQGQGTGPEIVISPDGTRWSRDDLVSEISRYAEELLAVFGSGREPGLPAARVDQLGAAAESELRIVVEAATRADFEAAFEQRRAELRREAEEAQRREAEEAERRPAEFKREAALKRKAELARGTELGREAERRELELSELRREAERREAELRREVERREAELSELRRKLELQQEAELAREGEPGKEAEVTAEREAEQADVARDNPQVPSGNAGTQRPADPAGLPAGPPGQGPQAEPPQTAPSTEKTRPAPRSPARALAGALESGANLLPWVRGRPASRDADAGPALLLECAARMRAGDKKAFRASISALRIYADAEISDEARRRYRVIVIKDRLLEPALPLGSMAVQFYDVMLRLAYGLPLSYAAYGEVEDLLSVNDEPGQPPHRPLLEAICGAGTPDVQVAAIVRYHLGPEWLTGWFRSGQVDVGQLIAALAGEWDRPLHVDLLYEVARQYLSGIWGHPDPQAVIAALRAHGYLAVALREHYPQSRRDQVTMLRAFLLAAYPDGLDRPAVTDILAARTLTRALLMAMLRSLADPADGPCTVRLLAGRLGGTSAAEEAAILELLMSDENE